MSVHRLFIGKTKIAKGIFSSFGSFQTASSGASDFVTCIGVLVTSKVYVSLIYNITQVLNNQYNKIETLKWQRNTAGFKTEIKYSGFTLGNKPDSEFYCLFLSPPLLFNVRGFAYSLFRL
jgi:hypothetical protein